MNGFNRELGKVQDRMRSDAEKRVRIQMAKGLPVEQHVYYEGGPVVTVCGKESAVLAEDYSNWTPPAWMQR